jgi:hypothetical protein
MLAPVRNEVDSFSARSLSTTHLSYVCQTQVYKLMLTDVWPRFLVSEEFKALSARKELRMLGLDALMAPASPAPKPRAETVIFLSSHGKRRPWAEAWNPLPERRERRRKTPAAAAAAANSMFNERQFNSAPGRAPGSAPGSTTVSAPSSPQRDVRKGVTFNSGTFASARPPSPISSSSSSSTCPSTPKQQAAAAAAVAGSDDSSSAVMGATATVAAAADSASADDADDDCADESDPVFDGSNPMDAPVSLESIVFAAAAAVSAS